jgi:hypothetical protein
MDRLRRRVAVRRHRVDDAGGVWIVTGIVFGILLYALIVLMDVAGFTPVEPLVVIPPVLVAMIGGNSLLGGGRTRGRTAPAPQPAPGSEGDGRAGRPPTGPNGREPGGPA